MIRTSKWMMPVVALGLLLGLSVAPAVAADTGSISGTVTGTDGKPAEGAMVRLMPFPPKADDAGGRPTPVATATTAADGKFEMKGVAPGSYVLQAGIRKVAQGRERVTVAAGQEEVVAITLKSGDEKPAAGEGGQDGEKKQKKGKGEKGEKKEKKNKKAEDSN